MDSESNQLLRDALFDRFYTNMSWAKLSSTYGTPVGILRRNFKAWMKQYPKSQPTSSEDVQIVLKNAGRPSSFTLEEEKVIAKSVAYFATNNTPLSCQGVLDLVECYVKGLPNHRRDQLPFNDNRPSLMWLGRFMKRNGFRSTSVALIEDKREKAVTADNLCEHLQRVQAVFDRFNIKDPRHVFNLDESGASFHQITGRSLRKGVCMKGQKVQRIAVRTKGNLDHVTIMSVVSAAGVALKPVVVFPGKQAHYRKVQGQVQCLTSVLPPCHVFYHNPAGVSSTIFSEWARLFVEEAKFIRSEQQYLLLILDGFAVHITYDVLSYLQGHRIVVIALPAHTSHVLQPLDVSVFSSYKSYLQAEVHKCSRVKSVLNAFDIAGCIRDAYTRSHTSGNIISGFLRTGIWDPVKLRTNISVVEVILGKYGKDTSTVEKLISFFLKMQRSLLHPMDLEEEGRIKIDTSSGLHLTSANVIDALAKREARRRRPVVSIREEVDDYKEPKRDIQRLIQLAGVRKSRWNSLRASRKARRYRQRSRLLA